MDVRLYDVIYKLLEEMELAVKGMMPKKIIIKVLGAAEVKRMFRIPKVGTIGQFGAQRHNCAQQPSARASWRAGNLQRHGELAVAQHRRCARSARWLGVRH